MIRIITSEKNRYPCYHGYDNKDIKNYTTLKLRGAPEDVFRGLSTI